MSDDSVQRRLFRRWQDAPDDKALALLDESGGYGWSSFGELYEAALERAAVLAGEGVEPGDVCILIPENDNFSITSLLGVLVLGAVPVCCSPPVVRGRHSNLKEVIEYLLRLTGARAVIASATVAPLVEELRETRRGVRFLFGEALDSDGSQRPITPHMPAATDVVAYQLTSGTTGFPKVCVWQQKKVLAALDGMVESMKLTRRDICVNWTPLYHDMGLVNNFALCMVHAVPLVMLSTFDFVKSPASWLRALTETGATVTWSPNFGFSIAANWVRDDQLEGIDLSSVRAFYNAAERIHMETIEAFQRRFAPYGVSREAMKTNFGMAENVGGATFSDPDGLFESELVDSDTLFKKGIAVPVDESADGAMIAVGVGRPYPGLGIKIISHTRKVLPDGHVGEIALDSPSAMEGYLKNARETRRTLVDGLLRTSDIGYLRDGELYWLGRKKERINLNGKKYDPSDFEKALLSVDGLRKGCFAAFGVPDPEAGTERLVIVAERRSDGQIADTMLMRAVAGSINSHLGVKPGEVILVGAGTMTKTSSGKRRHRHYRDLYMRGQLTASSG